MKIYRGHNCGRHHRTWTTHARCLWPKATWITGDGPHALLAHCSRLTVTLHATAAEATQAKAQIDRTRCGSLCTGHHEIATLDRNTTPTTAEPITAVNP